MDRRCVVVVADDLTTAQKAVQAAHAAQVFAGRYPGRYDSTTLVIVEAPTATLARIDQTAVFEPESRLRLARFCEPDLGGRLTAVCVAGAAARKYVSRLPLAFRTA